MAILMETDENGDGVFNRKDEKLIIDKYNCEADEVIDKLWSVLAPAASNRIVYYDSSVMKVSINTPSVSLNEKSVSAGISVDGYSGGWKVGRLSANVFDFGHAEAGVSISENEVSISAFASIWSPSVSVGCGKFTKGISLEVGTVGFGFSSREGYRRVKFGIGIIGITISF